MLTYKEQIVKMYQPLAKLYNIDKGNNNSYNSGAMSSLAEVVGMNESSVSSKFKNRTKTIKFCEKAFLRFCGFVQSIP